MLSNRFRTIQSLSILVVLLGGIACQGPTAETTASSGTQYTRLPADQTGIDFINRLSTDGNFDVFRYRNYYNGGGVAIGDVNNDGLPDIYLSANSLSNRLYLNRGELQFEDVTESAGVGGTRGWSTGVAMADVNGDGWLDIYVCNSGNVQGDDKENELFINQGDGTFREEAAAYGLADSGFGTHGVFFDYDRDGDLDCYLLNNSFRPVGTLGYRNIRDERDERGGDKLFRNDNGRFVDVSQESGIFGSVIGFGLGVTVGDVNLDGWPDIYISNDFFERDYLYVNQQDGTFAERLTDFVSNTSLSSMGADMADLNNDGYPEIFVTDMLPEDPIRLKKTSTFQSWDVYQLRLQNDYYHQFMRNTLQLNRGDGSFSEIGQLAGVAATDWSWGALMADYDNDGRRDILVCNGVYKDVTDQDFVNFLASDENIAAAQRGEKIDFDRFIDAMPSHRLSNYLFIREPGGMHFANKAKEWGLGEPSHSNGAAYGDLDNDGDLDLVINNVNQELFFYRNDEAANNYLRIQLAGEGANTRAVGSRILVRVGEDIFTYEHMPMRGFQSSMDYTAVIGLGEHERVDEVQIRWPDGRISRLGPQQVNQTLDVSPDRFPPADKPAAAGLASELAAADPPFAVAENTGLAVEHTENQFVDFDRDKMMYYMLSAEGPAVAVADVNGDGREDVYFGGSGQTPGRLLLQNSNGTFREQSTPAFAAAAASEDVDAAFFDADGDGDPDLYVVSGGNEYAASGNELLDRLYLNEGGNFRRAPDALPRLERIGSCVAPADVDGDGDTDLFLGTRVRSLAYGEPADSYLLLNDGTGRFTEAGMRQTRALRGLGMVTDAAWTDYDGDGTLDLIVVGEWMPVTVFRNTGGSLEPLDVPGLENSHGWWKRLVLADLDGDGRRDLVLGNTGWNTKFSASAEAPLELYVKDFDRNGTAEQVFAFHYGDRTLPMILRHDLVKQLPYLNKRFLKYADYAERTVAEIFGPEELADATHLSAQTLSTSIALRTDAGFELRALPWQAQVTPVYAIAVADVNQDGNQDVLLGGNFYYAKPEVGRHDAGYGLLLTGDGTGAFTPVSAQASGLRLPGQVRHLALIRSGNGRLLLAARNDDRALVYRLNPTTAIPIN